MAVGAGVTLDTFPTTVPPTIVQVDLHSVFVGPGLMATATLVMIDVRNIDVVVDSAGVCWVVCRIVRWVVGGVVRWIV